MCCENAEPNVGGSGWNLMDLNGLFKFILILWIRASGFDRIWNDLFISEWIWLDIYGRLVLMDLAGFWADVAGLIGFGWAWVVGTLVGGLFRNHSEWYVIPKPVRMERPFRMDGSSEWKAMPCVHIVAKI